jgi:glutathione S-transferase
MPGPSTDELAFYTNPMSRGRIIRWMLEETGAPYRTELLDFASSLKAPAYLAINPMGKIPAITHRGVTVTECAAICAYLADAFPDAKLAPPPADRGAYYRWLFFGAGPLESAATNKSLGFTVPPGREVMAGYGSFERTIDTLEAALAPGGYIAGSAFTAADVYVGSQLSWLMMFGTIDKRPAFADYVARLHARPAAQRAAQIDDGLIAAAQAASQPAPETADA